MSDVVRTPDRGRRNGRILRARLEDQGTRDARREVLSTPADKTLGGLPREQSARAGGRGPRRPALFGLTEVHAGADESPAPVYGAFPRGFLRWVLRQLGCAPREVLHVCSGMLTVDDVGGGLRVDLRPDARPDVVADGRALPFPDGVFGGVTIDPPYSVEYAEQLYGTDYPRPSHLLAEAARVVRPSGRIAFVHYLVASPPPGCRIVAIRGVIQGCGYRIRACTIYEREQDGLFDAEEAVDD